MINDYYPDLIERLKNAADWVNHQMDPAPDYEGLLVEAADAIKFLFGWLPPFLKDKGDSWSNEPKQTGDQDKR